MMEKIGDLTRQLYYVANEALYGPRAVWEHRYWKIQENVRDVQSIAKDISKMTKTYVIHDNTDPGLRNKIDGRIGDYIKSKARLNRNVENLRKDYGLDTFNEDFIDNMVNYASNVFLNSLALLGDANDSSK